MKIYIHLFLSIFVFIFFFFLGTSAADAQVCGGTFTCRKFNSYVNLDPPGCFPYDPFFPCTSWETVYDVSEPISCSVEAAPFACSNFYTVCYNGGYSELESENCALPPDNSPTPTPLCGGGPISYCNGGPYGCCGTGLYCSPPNPSNSNFSCLTEPPATPTPCPPAGSNYTQTCTGGVVTESYANGSCGTSGGSYTCPSGVCSGNACAGPSPTPTTSACSTVGSSCGSGCCPGATCNVATNTCVASGGGSTPTPAPSCGNGLSCTQDSNCPGVMVCSSGCCADPGGGGGGGGTCHPEGWGCAYNPCCAGLTCVYESTFTAGDNGMVCRVVSTSAPTPTTNQNIILSGSVFLDSNKNGVKSASEINYNAGYGGIGFAFHGTVSDTTLDSCSNGIVLGSGGVINFYGQDSYPCTNYLNNIRSLEALSENNYRYTNASQNPGTVTQDKSLVFSGGVPNPNPLNFGIWPVVTIQGWLTDSSGNIGSTPPAGAGVTITGPQEGGSSTQSKTSNQWDFTQIWAGTYTVTAANVAGYGTSYMCNGGDCGSLTQGVWNTGNTFPHSLQNPGSYLDLYIRYTPQRLPPTPCLVSGAGDVNGDGFVDSADVTLVLQYVVGSITLTPAQITRADVNGSGTITAADIAGINSYVAGTISTFPVCSTSTPTATPTTAVCSGTTASQTVRGNIYLDTNGDSCNTSTTLYSDTAPTMLFQNDGVTRASSVYNVSGASPRYTVTDSASCSVGTKTVVISNLPSLYSVRATRTNAGTWSSLSGYTHTLSTTSGTTDLDWCVSNSSSWYQTESGDVRFPSLVNKVPAGEVGSKSLSGTTNTPGVFFSSDGSISTVTFGQGAVSASNWKVGDEYDYNADFKNGLGGMSYTFFTSQTRKKELPKVTISSATWSLNNPDTGIYQRDGDLTITGGSLTNLGRHIVLLVNGNVTITAPITIQQGQGNLFVLAAKGNITIDPSVGVAPNSSTTSLDGYYTAEGDIILSHNASATCSPTSDLRLNVSGALIANSLRPFAVGGAGNIQNNRTLCANNAVYPSLYVIARPEFLLQLTDFYKTTYKVYKEVNP